MSAVVNLLSMLEATGNTSDADLADRLRQVLPSVTPESPIDAGVRFVALDGDDGNSGLSWASAMRNPSTAANTLPKQTIGGVSSPVGQVHVGQGTFLDQSIPLSAAISYVGVGPTLWDRGTTIKLRDNATDHLFRYDPLYDDGAHGIRVAHLVIDGNKANQTGEWSGIKINRGGFNTTLDDVSIHNTSGPAIQCDGRPLNLDIRNTTVNNCASALVVDGNVIPGTLASLTWHGGQIDNCGAVPISIDNGPGLDLETRSYQFTGIKFESDGQHQQCIRVVPVTSGRLSVGLQGVWARNWPGSGDAVVFEADGPGNPTLFTLDRVLVDDQVAHAFRSDKTGSNHAGSAQFEVFP